MYVSKILDIYFERIQIVSVRGNNEFISTHNFRHFKRFFSRAQLLKGRPTWIDIAVQKGFPSQMFDQRRERQTRRSYLRNWGPFFRIRTLRASKVNERFRAELVINIRCYMKIIQMNRIPTFEDESFFSPRFYDPEKLILFEKRKYFLNFSQRKKERNCCRDDGEIRDYVLYSQQSRYF